MAEQVFPSLYGTSLRLTRDREEASDLTQEALAERKTEVERTSGEAKCMNRRGERSSPIFATPK